MHISMKHFMTKIVFNKNHSIWEYGPILGLCWIPILHQIMSIFNFLDNTKYLPESSARSAFSIKDVCNDLKKH